MKESAQNYLETIFLIQREEGRVRSVDVARTLEVTKPSVSRAMGLLKEEGLIDMNQDGSLKLTKEGKKQAKSILARRETITQFLMMTTDVSQETAEIDAVKMRHFLSDEIFQGIKNFIKQVEEYNEQDGK